MLSIRHSAWGLGLLLLGGFDRPSDRTVPNAHSTSIAAHALKRRSRSSTLPKRSPNTWTFKSLYRAIRLPQKSQRPRLRIFGGDPRFVHLEIIFRINIWYDIVLLPILVIIQLMRMSEVQGVLILVPFVLFEVIRIVLHKSHRTGDIPLYVAFLMLTVLPMIVLDIIWLVAMPHRTGVDSSAMVGYIVLHALQLGFCTTVYRAFKSYQGGFYQFARGFDRRADGGDLGVEASD
jgi:hypothetical protein